MITTQQLKVRIREIAFQEVGKLSTNGYDEDNRNQASDEMFSDLVTSQNKETAKANCLEILKLRGLGSELSNKSQTLLAAAKFRLWSYIDLQVLACYVSWMDQNAEVVGRLGKYTAKAKA